MNSPHQDERYADERMLWTVTIGEYDRSSSGNKEKEPHEHVDKKIKTLIRHKHFDRKTFNYDIALIEIDGLPVFYQVFN